jgi:hypothetical protein
MREKIRRKNPLHLKFTRRQKKDRIIKFNFMSSEDDVCKHTSMLVHNTIDLLNSCTLHYKKLVSLCFQSSFSAALRTFCEIVHEQEKDGCFKHSACIEN